MSSNLVIVAIPDETDRVWKVSSEKIPHLTILHLGDSEQVSNLEQIMEFVEHAASTSLCRFYLPVDRRGELGDANADVLFFKKNRYDFKAVRDFRSLLLKDSNVKTAYDSTAQFEAPEHVGKPGHPWIPHLTLGYPETPAKPIPDEYGTIYSVDFNKLAVWTGDFDGPDWMLKDYWDEFENVDMDAPLSVAMSGVKGMKWGVRKVDVAKGGHILVSERTGRAKVSDAVATAIIVPAIIMPLVTPLAFLSPRVRSEVKAVRTHNKGVTADAKWQKQIDKGKKAAEVHNTASVEINKKIPDFNNDTRWKGVDLTKNPAKQKEYDDASVKELLNPEYAKAAVKVHGSSPTGRYKFEIKNESEGLVKLVDTQIEHAADDELSLTLKILRDSTGHILGFEAPEEDKMVHGEELDEFLEHFGIKGMKWGVRNAAAKVGRGVKAVGRGLATWHSQLADSHWESSIYSDNGHENVHNHVAENIDHHVDKLARSPKYREKNLRTDRELQREYYQDVARVTDVAYKKAVKDVYGENYTGTKKARYIQDPRGPRIEIRDKKTGDLQDSTPLSSMRDIKQRRTQAENDAFVQNTLGEKAVHAATGVDAPDISIDLKLNELGQISGVTFVELSATSEDSMAQTADLGADFILEHYGVKGMHWGQRKAPPAAVTPTATSKVPHGRKSKTKIEVKGGENHDAHEDAIKVAEARAKLVRSGPAALSNKELQNVANRVELEDRVARVTQSKGRRFVSKQLGQTRDQTAQFLINREIKKKL